MASLIQRLNASKLNAKTGKKTEQSFVAQNAQTPCKQGACVHPASCLEAMPVVSAHPTPNNHSKTNNKTTKNPNNKADKKLGEIGRALILSTDHQTNLYAMTINFDETKSADFLNRANTAKQSESATQYYSRQINKALKQEGIALFAYAYDISKENLVHIHGLITATAQQEQSARKRLAQLLRKAGSKPTHRQTHSQPANEAPEGFLGYALNTYNSKDKQHLKAFHNLPNIGKPLTVSTPLKQLIKTTKEETPTMETTTHLNDHQATETGQPTTTTQPTTSDPEQGYKAQLQAYKTLADIYTHQITFDREYPELQLIKEREHELIIEFIRIANQPNPKDKLKQLMELDHLNNLITALQDN